MCKLTFKYFGGGCVWENNLYNLKVVNECILHQSIESNVAHKEYCCDHLIKVTLRIEKLDVC